MDEHVVEIFLEGIPEEERKKVYEKLTEFVDKNFDGVYVTPPEKYTNLDLFLEKVKIFSLKVEKFLGGVK